MNISTNSVVLLVTEILIIRLSCCPALAACMQILSPLGSQYPCTTLCMFEHLAVGLVSTSGDEQTQVSKCGPTAYNDFLPKIEIMI